MSLTPLTSNLGVSRAKHLLRRACFHYNKNLLYTISELILMLKELSSFVSASIKSSITNEETEVIDNVINHLCVKDYYDIEYDKYVFHENDNLNMNIKIILIKELIVVLPVP